MALMKNRKKRDGEAKFAKAVADSQQPMTLLPMWPRIIAFAFALAMIAGMGCLLGAYARMDGLGTLPYIGNAAIYGDAVLGDITLREMLSAGGSLTILGCSLGAVLAIFLGIWFMRALTAKAKTPKAALRAKVATGLALTVVLAVTLMFFEIVTRSNIVVQSSTSLGIIPLGQFSAHPEMNGDNYGLMLGFGLALSFLGLVFTLHGVSRTAEGTIIKPVVIESETEEALAQSNLA